MSKPEPGRAAYEAWRRGAEARHPGQPTWEQLPSQHQAQWAQAETRPLTDAEYLVHRINATDNAMTKMMGVIAAYLPPDGQQHIVTIAKAWDEERKQLEQRGRKLP